MAILYDTHFVYLLAFVVFVGLVIYFGVPKLIAGKLDERAAKIKAEIDEARMLREEAQELLAKFERQQRDVAGHADAIVAQAREDAEIAAKDAHKTLEESIKRRLKAAEEQIASAEAAAVRQVRNRAVSVAVAAASEVIAARMTDERDAALIDAALDRVGEKLH